MGKILGLKSINEKKVIVNLELTQKEHLRLKGNLDDIYAFAKHNLVSETRLVQRGKRESTKYFLLPRELRDDIQPSNNVKCNKIELENSTIFIFEVNKVNLKK